MGVLINGVDFDSIPRYLQPVVVMAITDSELDHTEYTGEFEVTINGKHIDIIKLARQWMMDEVPNYYDGIDINTTRLAEDAADQFDIYNDDIDFTIPEWVYELAVEVEAWYMEDVPYWYEETDDDESEDW